MASVNPRPPTLLTGADQLWGLAVAPPAGLEVFARLSGFSATALFGSSKGLKLECLAYLGFSSFSLCPAFSAMAGFSASCINTVLGRCNGDIFHTLAICYSISVMAGACTEPLWLFIQQGLPNDWSRPDSLDAKSGSTATC